MSQQKPIDEPTKDDTIGGMSGVAAENLVPVIEAARRLGLSYVQVGNHIRAGRIRAMKIGRAYVVDEASIDEFASLRRKPGNPNFSKKSS